MTFEEFFSKKRIDLVQLKQADPELYAEFKSHFLLMGEKSFDHSKKFWFNKLRHSYHLETPAKQVITQVETKIASQAEPLSSPTMEQTVNTAGAGAADKTTPPKAAEPSVTAQESPAIKKSPFRPRNIKPVSEELSEDAQKAESRPGQTEASNTPITSPSSSDNKDEAPRPAYKPKFNVRNIPKSPSGAKEQAGSTTEEKIVAEDAESGTEQKGNPAKPAYKPRFNVKNAASKAEQADIKDNPSDEAALKAPATKASLEKAKPDAHEETNRPEEEIKPKPAYKPRFKAGNIKPKKED